MSDAFVAPHHWLIRVVLTYACYSFVRSVYHRHIRHKAGRQDGGVDKMNTQHVCSLSACLCFASRMAAPTSSQDSIVGGSESGGAISE